MESDALRVVNMINLDTKVCTEIGLIIADIRDRFQDMVRSLVVFAHRNMNVVTHTHYFVWNHTLERYV